MSRIGKKSIKIPEGVQVEYKEGKVLVKGSKGSLDLECPRELEVKIEDDKEVKEINVIKKGKTLQAEASWGTIASLISNMITGVTEGYQKQLELNGVGFRMAVKGKKLDLALGFSHPVEVEIPDDIQVEIKAEIMTISGIDKQKVGQLAAQIRSLKPVEPYKGKGFKYVGEVVRRKEGKKAVATT